ncbi:MAG: substrate-binding domain-containing protein [Clostridiales bacterium]|nr:substrate-binding domain-containing protein [Clostridiales bacterium]
MQKKTNWFEFFECFHLASPHWRVGRTARWLLEEADIHPKTIDFSIVEAAVAAAGCGLGVTFCSDIMAKRGSFTKTPAYFSVGNEPKTMEFILAHRKDFPLTKAYQDFIRVSQAVNTAVRPSSAAWYENSG